MLPENQDLVTGGDILTEEDEPEEETAFSKENEHQPKIAFTPRTDRKRKGRRRYGVFVGSLVLLLALVGVVFLVSAVSGQIRGWFAGEEIDLRSYDGFLAPVVMQDPAPFESIEGANSDMVITAGLWYMLMNQSDKVYTEYDESAD